MSEVLTNGIKVPDKGSRSWYDDMRGDLVKLDALIGSASSVTVNPIITSGIEIASINVNGTSYSLYQQGGDITVNIKPVITNAELPILLSKSAEENTDTVDMSVGVTVNPSSNTVTATNFVGDLNGNATSSTKATQDASGNVITDTYATKSDNALKANDADVVHLTGDETISGSKTFSSNIVGNLTGNADTAGNGVDSNGDFWIRFKNGIQMCWGSGSFQQEITYSKAFNSEPRLICTPAKVVDALNVLVVNFYIKSSTTFACILWNVNTGDWGRSGNFDWLAIGTWR